MYKYFVVDSWLLDDKCTFEYLDKYHWGYDNYDSASCVLEDKIREYGFKREDLKIVKVN